MPIQSDNCNCSLIVLTGPSGVGKGSLVKELISRHQTIWLSVSATTRNPREGEVDGKHYFFLERSHFEDLIQSGGFLEWAEFAGNLYGTPSKEVQTKLDSGVSVLLEIELNGARQIRANFPNAIQIFIAPPNFDELERRIRFRGTESDDSITKRLARAKEELKALNEFDEIVVNDELQTALIDLEKKAGLST